MKCKTCKFGFSLIVFGVFAWLAWLSHSRYPGGTAYVSPLENRILAEISSFWCSGVTISSENNVTFNATLNFGTPPLNPEIRTKTQIKLYNVPLPLHKPRAYWRFHLPKTSVIDVGQCAGTYEVTSYIFESEEVVDGCVTLKKDEERLKGAYVLPSMNDVCSNITLQRCMLDVCLFAPRQNMHATVMNTDFYILLYQNSFKQDSYISAIIDLDQPTLDFREIPPPPSYCSSHTECTLTLEEPWAVMTVIAKLLVDPLSRGSTLKWSVQPRLLCYIIVFLVPLLFIIPCVWGFVDGCAEPSKMTRESDPPVESTPPDFTPAEVESERQPLLDSRHHGYATTINVDLRISAMGPIPGPVHTNVSERKMPTAPPEDDGSDGLDYRPFRERTSQQNVDENFQPMYPEPPPTYEESQRRKAEAVKQSQMY